MVAGAETDRHDSQPPRRGKHRDLTPALPRVSGLQVGGPVMEECQEWCVLWEVRLCLGSFQTLYSIAALSTVVQLSERWRWERRAAIFGEPHTACHV